MTGRIIITTSKYPPEVGGTGVHFSLLKQALEKLNIPVTVLVRPGLLDLIAKTRREDIVLGHTTPRVLFPIFIGSFFCGYRVVIRVGGDFFWERAVEEGRFFGTLRGFYARGTFTFRERCVLWLTGIALRRADAVVFTSPLLHDIYIPFFCLDQRKTHTITHAVSKLPAAPSRRPQVGGFSSVVRMLYAGRFIKLKNLNMLLEVFAETKKKFANIKLVLIGDGHEEEVLKLKMRDLGLEQAVEFKKPMEHVNILQELAASDLAVLPSLSEVSPNLLTDALSVATPILATRENGLVRIIGEAGVWFDPALKEDFSRKLEEILQPGMLQELGRRIADHPYRKTWDEVAEEYQKVISNI
ncbi:MAG: glycosyltransferase family 4 protein [bacterium]|nr:glycosyltransferase family 4 protein [bacterium]